MLILRRICGQSIVIGEDAEIIVKVLRDENGIISIGIDAPKSIRVDRLEIFEKRFLDSQIKVNSEYVVNRLKGHSRRLVPPLV